MAGGFVKLYGTILDSSVWSEDAFTRLVWITMLAMADAEGFVEAAIPGLARRANVPIEDCEAALARLEAPDPYSKSTENEGRRIKRAERGWIILNYKHYRELRTPAQIASAERQALYRERHRPVTSNKHNGDMTEVSASASASSTEGVQGEPRIVMPPMTPERQALKDARDAIRRELLRVVELGKGDGQRELRRASLTNRGNAIINPESCSSLPWLQTTLERLTARRLELEEQRSEAPSRVAPWERYEPDPPPKAGSKA